MPAVGGTRRRWSALLNEVGIAVISHEKLVVGRVAELQFIDFEFKANGGPGW